tara:strand:+ start:2361 stop:4592 length:2232 start_codon:yes stop_codon:yes gene_type:complete
MAGRGPSKISIEIGGKVDAFQHSLKQAQRSVSTFTERTKRSFNDAAIASKRAFKNITGNALWQQSAIAAAGIGTVLVANVRSAVQFEEAMADVKKVVDFPTPKAFKEMNRDILNLSKKIPVTAAGLAEIVAAAGQAGIAREELTSFADTAAKMAIAFDMTAGEAGEAMAKMRTAMGLNQEEVTALADAMNHLSNNMASTAPQITNFMLRVGAEAKQFAFAEEQVAAFGSAMIAAGAAPEVAATSFRNLTKALSAGSNATKKQREAFSELGLDAVEVSEMMQEDAAGTIQKVFKLLQNVDPAKRASMTKMLFGSEARALAPLLTNMDLLDEALKTVADNELFKGSMLKEFEARSGTAANQMQLFRNNLKALSIVLGTTVLPVLNAVIGALTPIIGGLAGLVERFPILGGAIMLVSGVFVGLIALMPLVASGFILMSAGLTSFKALAAAGIFAKLGTSVMMLGGIIKAFAIGSIKAMIPLIGTVWTLAAPFLPIIAAVAGVGAALYALWKFRKPVGNAFKFIGKVAFGQIYKIWDAIKWIWSTASNGLRDFIQMYIDFWKTLPQKLFNIGKGMVMALWNGLKDMWTKLKAWLVEIVDWIKDLNPFKGWGEAIENAINGLKFWNKNKDNSVDDTSDGDGEGKVLIPLKKDGGGILGPMPDVNNFDSNPMKRDFQGLEIPMGEVGTLEGGTTENLSNSKTTVVNNNVEGFTINVGSGVPEEIGEQVQEALVAALNDATSDQRALLSD